MGSYCGKKWQSGNLLFYSGIISERDLLFMKKNIGNIDRILRGGAAIVLILLSLTGLIEGQAAVFAGIGAIVLLLTGLTGMCPCYVRLNYTTLKKK